MNEFVKKEAALDESVILIATVKVNGLIEDLFDNLRSV